jgi:hypothetical protein
MSARWRWILVVTLAAALDLLLRFGAPFDLGRVMHVEVVLFPVTAMVLAALLRSQPSGRRWVHMVQIGLVWLFGLGGIRPILWTLGLSLLVANLGTAVAMMGGIVVWRFRRRRRAPPQ